MSDADIAKLFQEMQMAVLNATRRAIEDHAVHLPTAMLRQYLAEMGGSVFVVRPGQVGTLDRNPFRIRVIEHTRMAQGADGRIVTVGYVKQVLGWG